jgi:5-methylcytosine-specific restriction protein A
MSHNRLRGSGLQKRNAGILAKEPLCRRCKALGYIKAAEEVDHIVPLALGGTEAHTNLRPLCGDCHKVVTAEQFGHRERLPIGADGWPMQAVADARSNCDIDTSSRISRADRRGDGYKS